MPYPYNATYQPVNQGALIFGFLVERPERVTTQSISERLIPGSNDAVIDIIGKPVTKVRGRGRFPSFQSLKTFEGAVGTSGTLIYAEEPLGLSVILVEIARDQVLVSGENLAGIEFWVLPNGTTLV